MTVFRTVILLLFVFECALISTLPIFSSIKGDESRSADAVSAAKKIAFHPIPLTVPVSKADGVIHKNPGELQHFLAEKHENPFLPSKNPDHVAQKFSDHLKHPVKMQLDPKKKNNLIIGDKAASSTTVEPEDFVTYFTDELHGHQLSTVASEMTSFKPTSNMEQKPNKTSKREIGRPPVKLLQRLLHDYLPVITPEIKTSTPPIRNPVTSTLAPKKLKPTPPMAYQVSKNSQFISLLNTLNFILNRRILPPKTYAPFKVPRYNVSLPNLSVSETQERPHFENSVTTLSSSTAHDVTSVPNVEVTSSPVPTKTAVSSTFSSFLDSETALSSAEHETSHIKDNSNFDDQPTPSQLHFETADITQEKKSTPVPETKNPSTLGQANEPVENDFQESTEKLKKTTSYETISENDLGLIDKTTTADSETPAPTICAISEGMIITEQEPEADFEHNPYFEGVTTNQQAEDDFEHNQYFEGETTGYTDHSHDVETTSTLYYHHTDFSQSATEPTTIEPLTVVTTSFVAAENPKETTVSETAVPTTELITNDQMEDESQTLSTIADYATSFESVTTDTVGSLQNSNSELIDIRYGTVGTLTNFLSTENLKEFEQTSATDSTAAIDIIFNNQPMESTIADYVTSSKPVITDSTSYSTQHSIIELTEHVTVQKPSNSESVENQEMSTFFYNSFPTTDSVTTIFTSNDQPMEDESETFTNYAMSSESVAEAGTVDSTQPSKTEITTTTAYFGQPESPTESTVFNVSMTDSSAIEFSMNAQSIDEESQMLSTTTISESVAESLIDSPQHLPYPTEIEGESYDAHQTQSPPIQESETSSEVVFESESTRQPEMTVDFSHLASSQLSHGSATFETSPITSYFTTVESMVGDHSDVDWTTVSTELPSHSSAFDATPPEPIFDFEGVTQNSLTTSHSELTSELEEPTHQQIYTDTNFETTTYISDETEVEQIAIVDGVWTTLPSIDLEHTPEFENEIDATNEDSFTIMEHPEFLSSSEETFGGNSTQENYLFNLVNKVLNNMSTITQSMTEEPQYLEDVTEHATHDVTYTLNFEGAVSATRPSDNLVVSEVSDGDAQSKLYLTTKYDDFRNEDTTKSDVEHGNKGETAESSIDHTTRLYDKSESDSNANKRTGDVVTASQTEGLIFSTIPISEAKSETTQLETTHAHKTTTESYPDTTDDLIHSPTTILSTLGTADHVTAEGQTVSLFLGTETTSGVTVEESTVLSTTLGGTSNSRPAENFTTELLFTDPEEEEIEDPFDCGPSTVDGSTKVTSPQTGCDSKTDPPKSTLKENGVSREGNQDENTVPYESSTPATLQKTDGLKVSENLPQNLENFSDKPQTVKPPLSLTTSSKQRAEKLLNLLSGEIVVSGAEELEDNNETDQDYEFDGSGMKIVKGGQRKGKWIENLSNDELKALIESIKLKHFRN